MLRAYANWSLTKSTDQCFDNRWVTQDAVPAPVVSRRCGAWRARTRRAPILQDVMVSMMGQLDREARAPHDGHWLTERRRWFRAP
jgi:hypothetical protein